MDFLLLAFLSVIFSIVELVYFKIADHYNIIDKPNHRSSHTSLTIRGGGIIFSISVLLFFFLNNFRYPFFMLGLAMVASISLADDIVTLTNKYRLGIHLLSVGLLVYGWDMYSNLSWWQLILVVVFIIGIMNAYNFMDGINGVTGAYSLVTMATLYYINEHFVNFADSNVIIYTGASILTFIFFNFRTKAKCFAGDVGSISLAFIVIFLLGMLIISTKNYSYLFFLTLYGLDTVTTIVFRIIRKENIFEAHRSHFYQYLVNVRMLPHLVVSAGYALFQLLINTLILKFPIKSISEIGLFILLAGACFLVIRFSTEGKKRLLKRKLPDVVG